VIVVVMGVAGSGKTSVGRVLAQKLGARFVEGDDFHPQSNVEKMRRGDPLDDRDRAPWLVALHAELVALSKDPAPIVVACSALKRAYRATLSADLPNVRFVHLAARREVLEARLGARTGHFVSPSLLDSQLEALELSPELMTIDATRPLETVAREIHERLSA
jgi:carbohydrate kinase (thermoresistant glucokinase family)